jgi:hypothetical protein
MDYFGVETFWCKPVSLFYQFWVKNKINEMPERE